MDMNIDINKDINIDINIRLNYKTLRSQLILSLPLIFLFLDILMTM